MDAIIQSFSHLFLNLLNAETLENLGHLGGEAFGLLQLRGARMVRKESDRRRLPQERISGQSLL
jgi:hypothetical protein